MKRYIYMCDGKVTDLFNCKKTQVIDAVDIRAADGIAREMGWILDGDGHCICNKKHKQLTERGLSA
jgi:hypothetical protein